MITLTGILRQSGELTIKDKPRLKIVVEHETARDNGVNDLHLETLFLDREEAAKLPKAGEAVHVEVRPYPINNGRAVAFAAVRLVGGAEPADPLAVA